MLYANINGVSKSLMGGGLQCPPTWRNSEQKSN